MGRALALPKALYWDITALDPISTHQGEVAGKKC